MKLTVPDAGLTARDGGMNVIGHLDFANVAGLVDPGKEFIRKSSELAIVVDLSGVILCNSAGIALMTEWLRYAKRLDKNLQFVNIPEQMRAIIELSGLGGIFGFGPKA